MSKQEILKIETDDIKLTIIGEKKTEEESSKLEKEKRPTFDEKTDTWYDPMGW